MSSASTGSTEGSSPASSPVPPRTLFLGRLPGGFTPVHNRIYVGNMPPSTTKAELAQVFSTYGNIKEIKILQCNSGVSRGYGFVTFETEEEAKRLLQETKFIVLGESTVYIAPAIEKRGRW